MQNKSVETAIGKRENWVDYAKFIGIIFVIFGHLLDKTHDPNVFGWVYSFHMPLFVILAGYFVNTNKTTSSVLKTSFKTLVVPYVCFYVIAFFTETLLLFLQDSNELTLEKNLLQPFLGLVFGKGYSTSISNNINVPLWFLLALFFCRVIFQFVVTRKGNIKVNLILLNIVSILLVFLLKYNEIQLFFSLDSALMVIPFYTFGYLLKKYSSRNNLSSLINALIAFLFLAISILVSPYNIEGDTFVDIATISYGKSIFLFYILGAFGALGVIYFSKVFDNKVNKLILCVGQNTIIILGVHFWITHYLLRLFARVNFALDRGQSMMLEDAMIMTIPVLIVSSIFIYIIPNYFPFIIGKTQYKNNLKQ